MVRDDECAYSGCCGGAHESTLSCDIVSLSHCTIAATELDWLSEIGHPNVILDNANR